MEKLNFKTVGQFLVALEEGPLYCNENFRFTFNAEEDLVTMTSLKSGSRRHYSKMPLIKEFIEKREFARKQPPQDKDLVWCCTDKDRFGKAIRFYDAENTATFRSTDGKRDGAWFSNYEVIPKNLETGLWDAPFDWANEAVKHLGD